MTGGGARQLVVLGTSAQAPTRERNQSGFVLRWDDRAVLFDPGEGTQQQLLRAGVNSGAISTVVITHLHGDHCLGLPGVLGRFVLDQRHDPVDLYFPETGLPYVERLCRAAIFDPFPHLRLHPVPLSPAAFDCDGFRLVARPLDHTVDTIGWRIEEEPVRHLLPDRLAEAGITGEDVGRFLAAGAADVDGRTVTIDDVSTLRPGQCFAFVMDTATCDSAVALAADADLVVCESTFLDSDGTLARERRHLTARQAGWIATEARARRLVLAHFSNRHPDVAPFAEEAGEVMGDVVAAHDLDVVDVPRRQRMLV